MARGSTWGNWSLMLGIIAIVLVIMAIPISFIPIINFCACFLGPVAFLSAVGAIIFGIIGLVQGKKSAKVKSIVGIILGVGYFFISVAIMILGLIFGFAMAGIGALDSIITVL